MSISPWASSVDEIVDPSVELLTPFPPEHVADIRELVLSDTLAFAREICGFRLDELATMQTGREVPSLIKEVHGPLCRFLARPGRRKMILMSRDSYKTSVVTIAYPLQRIARDPNDRILIDSDLRANAKKWLGMIRWHIEANPRFIQLFGSLKREPGWTDEFFTVVRSREHPESTVTSSGIDQVITGLHFRVTIASDLVNRTNIGTKEQRDKVRTHIRDLRPVIGAGDLIMEGTRWDDDDAYGRILTEEAGGRKITDIISQLRADGEAKIGRWLIFFRDCWGDGGEAGYKARGWGLVPKFTPEYLDDARKDMGEYDFSAQMLGDPVPQASAAFKKEHVEHYWEPPLPPGLQCTIIGDPAISEEQRAAFSAITACGYDPPTRHRYVLHAWHDKVDENVFVRKLLDIYEALVGDGLHVYALAVEEVALQKVYRGLIISEAERRGITTLPLRSLRKEEQRKNKLVRIRALAPLFEQLLFWLRPEHGDLIEELARFPRAATRDLIDTLAYHLDLQRALSQLVYPMFDPERHVVHKLPARFDRVAASLARPAVSEDWGLVVLGRSGKVWFAIEEAVIPRGTSNSDIISALHTVRTQYHIPQSKILLPPHELQMRAELVKMKFVVRLARAYRDPLALYSRLGTMLERDRFVVADHLEELKKEFTMFSWPEKGESILLRKPDLRYARLIGAVQLIIWQEEPPEKQYWPAPKDPLEAEEEAERERAGARRPYPTGYGYVRSSR